MPNSRRLKPANPSDDGSGGRFVRGLPADAAGLTPDPQIEYDAQAGAPVGYPGHGGTFTPNVSSRPAPVPRSPDPKPFKVK